MADKVARLLRLRKEIAALESELFDPACSLCGRYLSLGDASFWEAQTCPHHTMLCTGCQPCAQCKEVAGG